MFIDHESTIFPFNVRFSTNRSGDEYGYILCNLFDLGFFTSSVKNTPILIKCQKLGYLSKDFSFNYNKIKRNTEGYIKVKI